MKTKIWIIILVFLIFAVLSFLVLSFFSKKVEAPTPNFKGPTGSPYIKGPTGPPPSD